MSFKIQFKQLFPILALSLGLLAACNSGFAPPESPPQEAVAVVTDAEVTNETVRLVALQEAVIWAGPDVQYGQVGSLGAGQTADVIGRSELGTHWVISFPANATGQGWVAAANVSIQGDFSNVPVVFAQSLPELTEEPTSAQDDAAEPEDADGAANEAVEADAEPEGEDGDAVEDVTPEEDADEPTPETEPAPEDDDDADDNDTPSPADGTADDIAPEETEDDPTPAPPVVDGGKVDPEPTPAPPVVDGGKVDPEPTAVPPTNGIDKVAVQPTATPDITIDGGLTIAPTPTPELQILVAVPAFVQQPTYNDCANRPANTICLGFTDGYIWLIEDTVLAWSDGEHEGQLVLIAEGVKGYYHHLAGTSLVKFVPKS